MRNGVLRRMLVIGFGLLFFAWPAGPASSAPSRAPLISTSASARHTIARGETLWAVGRWHGVRPDAVARANGLRETDILQPGQVLDIPRSPRESGAQAERKVTQKPATDVPSRAAGTAPFGKLGAAAKTGAVGTVPAGTSLTRQRVARVVWPSRGTLTSYFGRRWRSHHTGIDISSPVGTPIFAARSGVVVLAGWYFGYGKTVIIDHGDGMTTLYGHASELLVGNGRTVRQGETIARVGTTGTTTGPNLHFEVRFNGSPVDPLPFLK